MAHNSQSETPALPASEAELKPTTYHLVTYGCQMNDNDSEIMAGILEAHGMSRVSGEEDADLVVVNTCVVREGAEDRAVGRIRQMAPLKRRRKGMIIAVAGCMAQKDGAQLLERLPHVDMVVGTRDLFKIASLVDRFVASGERVVAIEDIDRPVFLDAQPVRRKSGVKALATIMYGCDNHCAYCIVPRVRGHEVSRPLPEIVEEVRDLAWRGFREVTLLGQNVNSYSHDGRDFADLLEAIDALDGIDRVRFVTSHPKDCSDRLIAAMARLPKVCESIHLPAQAGSDEILKRMNRRYTREHYVALLGRIRQAMPGAAITTDLIVGFPGETEEDFERTAELLETARWDSAFIFMYSHRPGTPASRLDDTVPLGREETPTPATACPPGGYQRRDQRRLRRANRRGARRIGLPKIGAPTHGPHTRRQGRDLHRAEVADRETGQNPRDRGVSSHAQG